MRGMDRNTGKAVEGVEHLRQSVIDILTTPLGSRTMNREYGSRLFELIDAPVDGRFAVEMFQAVAEAINRWEPRFRVTRVQLVELTPQGPVFDLVGVDLETGVNVTLEQV